MFKGRSLVAFLVLLAFGFVAVGCGGGGEQADTGMEETTSEPAATGTLSATVNFDGEAPEPEEYDASANDECGVDTVEGQKVVVNDNGTLKNAVVAVKSGPDGLNQSPSDLTVDQKNCKYHPHVAVAKKGQEFEVGNSDAGLHNVRGTREDGSSFNETTPGKGQSVTITAEQTGVLSLECDVHPWMQSYVYITEHGAAGVTDDSGEVTLDELPEGDYTLEIWHEEYGTQTEEVTISEDEESSISVTFSA